MSHKHLPLTQFCRFENSLYFIKHDPEVIIFYSDRYFYISQEISHNACRCLLPWWNNIFYFDISLGTPLLYGGIFRTYIVLLFILCAWLFLFRRSFFLFYYLVRTTFLFCRLIFLFYYLVRTTFFLFCMSFFLFYYLVRTTFFSHVVFFSTVSCEPLID